VTLLIGIGALLFGIILLLDSRDGFAHFAGFASLGVGVVAILLHFELIAF
jgi:hypothetical protein